MAEFDGEVEDYKVYPLGGAVPFSCDRLTLYRVDHRRIRNCNVSALRESGGCVQHTPSQHRHTCGGAI